MPSEHDQLVNVLIDADTVVISIALVAGAGVVACERPRSSSSPRRAGYADCATNSRTRA